MVDKEVLQEMSKSQFGKYIPSQPNPWLEAYYKLFLKKTPFRSYLNGLVTAGILLHWWFTKETFFLYVWVGGIFFFSITGILYWGQEKKRLDKDIAKCDAEIREIQKEILERKEFFEGLKSQLAEENKQD